MAQTVCYHRWTKAGLCARPGCFVRREPGAPLKPHEIMHADRMDTQSAIPVNKTRPRKRKP